MTPLAYMYSVLAFAEVGMLFASIIGIIVLAVRCAIRAVDRVIETAVDASVPDAEPGARRQRRLNVAVQTGSHRIPGGHNERF